MKILVTGGLGYIGSHTCVELLKKEFEIVVIDNLSNSTFDMVEKIKDAAASDGIKKTKIYLYELDILESNDVKGVFKKEKPDVCMHFAGLKSVKESTENPLLYYENNFIGSLNLIKSMIKEECNKIIFSSSATVYGKPKSVPVVESSELNPANPYGWSKLMTEQLLLDVGNSQSDWSSVTLRYFNPVGAHKSGFIGENPKEKPNNLMPFIVRVANGEIPELEVFGNDYSTPDGTGIRDYIHVVDLAKGHVKALDWALKNKGNLTLNLGTGCGYSVLELIKEFERVNDLSLSFRFSPRRPGDVDCYFADVAMAREKIAWQAALGLEEMCKSAWVFEGKRTKK